MPQRACLNFLYFIKGGPCGAACLLYASPAEAADPLYASPAKPDRRMLPSVRSGGRRPGASGKVGGIVRARAEGRRPRRSRRDGDVSGGCPDFTGRLGEPSKSGAGRVAELVALNLWLPANG
jgi:hypothetical protein